MTSLYVFVLCVSDCCFLRSSVRCIIRRGSATDDFESSYKGKFRERLIQGSVARVLWLRFRLRTKKRGNHVKEFFFFLEKCWGHPERQVDWLTSSEVLSYILFRYDSLQGRHSNFLVCYTHWYRTSYDFKAELLTIISLRKQFMHTYNFSARTTDLPLVLRPATSTQGFLVFPVPKSKCWDGSQDSKLPLHASHIAHPT